MVALHLKGALETGPRRTLCATGPEPEGLGPFEGTVLDCLREPLTARELVRHSDVRLAVALARIPLADEGLLRYPRLGPTRGARAAGGVLAGTAPVADGQARTVGRGHAAGGRPARRRGPAHAPAALRAARRADGPGRPGRPGPLLTGPRPFPAVARRVRGLGLRRLGRGARGPLGRLRFVRRGRRGLTVPAHARGRPVG
ncbi:hypothetical protein R2F25_07455 [Streptomyces sp. UP1A-1]|nr:hypothetical protein [Streptomyces sp. UP1A-1]